MKTLGVIGGMGPMATAYFLERVTMLTGAQKDQEHLEIIVHSVPQIPDRTAFILGKSTENPSKLMLKTGKNLVEMGAQIIAVPCVTAHFFRNELESLPVPVMDGVQETAENLQDKKIRKVGILATDGTVSGGLFQSVLSVRGIETVLPDEKNQSRVMDLIYKDIKAGKTPNYEKLKEIANQLKERGAERILLGCTELSLLRRGCEESDIWSDYIDVLDVLAGKTVERCTK